MNDDRLRLIADALPALISYIGSDFRYRFCNAAYADWFGVSSQQVIGARVPAVIGKAVFAERRPFMEAALRGERVRFEGRMPHRAWSEPRDTDTIYIPDRDPEAHAAAGPVPGFFVFVHDITEIKAAARNQRRFLREMLKSLTEGRLLLADGPADLPAPEPPLSETIALSRQSLRLLRMRVAAVAEQMHLSKEHARDLLTAVGEASMNAVVHAGGGTARIHANPETGLIQVWIADHGAGISDESLPGALKKGVSSAGTLGHGFWLMLRTCDRIHLLTGVDDGTTLVLEQDRTPPPTAWHHFLNS